MNDFIMADIFLKVLILLVTAHFVLFIIYWIFETIEKRKEKKRK